MWFSDKQGIKVRTALMATDFIVEYKTALPTVDQSIKIFQSTFINGTQARRLGVQQNPNVQETYREESTC
jgi:hypothetical protein